MLLTTIQTVKKSLNKSLKVNGFLITLYEKRRDVSDWVENMEAAAATTNSFLYAARIRNSSAIANAPSCATSIFDFDAGSIGAQDYRAFVHEFLERENEKR